MTEQDARDWIDATFGAEVLERLGQFVERVIAENDRQNLVSRSTIATIWSRHVVDSAQLALFAPHASTWLDVGTGAGFPGLVIALLGKHHLTLVDPRRRRIDFLRDFLGTIKTVCKVELIQKRIETVHANSAYDVISARAVAPAAQIFASTRHLATARTRYLLPRGRSADTELVTAQAEWHGTFHVEQSLTDPDSGILVADSVTPR